MIQFPANPLLPLHSYNFQHAPLSSLTLRICLCFSSQCVEGLDQVRSILLLPTLSTSARS